MPSFDLYTATGGMTPEEIGGSLISSNKNKTQSVILFGSSSTAYDREADGATFTVNSASVWAYLRAKLAKSHALVRNAGVTGNNASMMLARLQSDVLDYDSDWVFVQAAINDFFGFDRNVDEVFNDVTSIVDQILAAGRKVLLQNCQPQVSTRSGYTTAKALKAVEYNLKLDDYAANKPNLYLADIASRLTDRSATDGSAISRYFANDGIHLSLHGSIVAAEQCLKALNGAFATGAESWSFSGLEDAATLTGTNPGLTGTGGGLVGGASGVAPDGYVLNASTGNTAVGAHGEQYYEVDITSTGASNALVRLISSDHIAKVNAGEVYKVRATMCVESDDSVGVVEISASLYTYDGTTITNAYWGLVNGGYKADTNLSTGDLVIETYDVTIPAGAVDLQSYVRIRLNGSGTAKLKIKEVRIIRVS